MMIRKFMAIFLAATLFLTLAAGCSSGSNSTTAPAGSASSPAGSASTPPGSSPTSSGSAGSTTPAFAKMDLKLNMVAAETSTWMEGAKKFAADVAKDTGNAVKMTIYNNEQLSGGNQSKAVEMLRGGSIDIDMRSGMIFSNLDDRFAVLNLPFMFPSVQDAVAKLKGEGGKKIGTLLDEKGIHLLGFLENGLRELTTNNRLVKNINDMKGLKIRVPAVKLYIDTFTAMGANPISMNFAEVYTSLQQGALDGQENPPDILRSTGVYEVQKYITMWDYSYDPVFFTMNKKLFDSMSPEMQKIFSARAVEAADYQKDFNRKVNNEAVDEMVAAGKLTKYVPTAEEMAGFKAACAPVVAAYSAKFGDDFMSAFK